MQKRKKENHNESFIISNRKGVASAISEMTSYFIAGIIIIIFWMLAIGIMKDNLEKQAHYIDNTKTDFLINLREPFFVQGTNIDSIAEAIILSEYNEELRKKTSQYLKEKYDKIYYNSWSIEIKYPNKERLSIGNNYKQEYNQVSETGIGTVTDILGELKKVEIKLPSQNEELIEIIFETWLKEKNE